MRYLKIYHTRENMDERIKKLAENLINHSIKMKKNEKVLIEYNGEKAVPLVKQLVKTIYEHKGIPYTKNIDMSLKREMLLNANKEQIELLAKIDAEFMENMDCYLRIDAEENPCEMADVPTEKLNMYNTYYSVPVHFNIREKKKWCILEYPTGTYANNSNMSLEKFEDFYFNVCTLDYEKMNKAMTPLVELMNKTDKVRIVAKGTDLTFSIKDIPAIKCSGECNIPDGEVYTAPVKNSVNGTISYNTPSIYQGFEFNNIKLKFKDGKIIEATSNDSERMNNILDTDEGARFVGEFAIGVNPYVISPMKDILFDEKISGSIHFTPGACYDDAPNGNGDSAVHWDLVLIQRPEYGGGEIYFDDVLIRKDGKFVLPELQVLNPENLK